MCRSLADVAFLYACMPPLSIILIASLTPAIAKTPGETHCYKKICHRVITIAETRRRIGRTTKIIATHYDHPSVDRYNTGKYTSSGEVFSAEDPTRASSSNLPDGTELLVWNPTNRRAIHVRINDFGPFHTNRELDLTRAAAEQLGFARAGVAELEVTVVAAPPVGSPRYKRGRRYPAALGFLGVLEKHHIEALAKRIRLGQQLSRMASIDIQKFLWTMKINELGEGSVVAGYALPVDAEIREHREAIGILPYAKASADPIWPPPPRLAEVDDAPHPHLSPGRLEAASNVDALPVRASPRSASADDQGPARFGLRMASAERAGWRPTRNLALSQSAIRLHQSQPDRLAALMTAPIWLPADAAKEVATADVNSIRWSIPGLDTFMRQMAPVWGTDVMPLHALQAAAAITVTLTMLLSAALERAYVELRSRGRSAPGPISALPARAMRAVAIASNWQPVAQVGRTNIRDIRDEPEVLVIRTKPHASIIARGLRVDGGVESTGTVIVAGTVHGDCRCHTLVIQACGRVEGDIEALRVEICGRFKGNVYAASLVIDARAEIDDGIAVSTISNQPLALPAKRTYALAAE